MSRVLLAVVIVILFCFLALGVMATLLKRNALFFPERYPSGLWNTSRFPSPPTEHFINTSDGVRLHSWLFRSSRIDPLLIWYHGNGGNLTHRADIAAELARRGVSVLLFDYRGYGRSQGRPTERGLYEDGTAVYDFARDSLGLKPEDIVVYGESLGGPYAAHVAASRGARCVIIENSFSSLTSVAKAVYPYLPFRFFISDSLRTTHWLNKANVPVLIMHGRRDRVIPYHLGKELYDSVQTSKVFFESQTAGHAEIPSVEGARYFETVVAFINRHAARGH